MITNLSNYPVIVDDFLQTFDHLRSVATKADFSGVVNPVDGIHYPDIFVDIPTNVLEEVQVNLNELAGRTVKINTIFMRLTSQNTFGAPHQAHTDTVMGDYTLLVYLNDGPGGTSFVTHNETGMSSDPTTEDELRAWQRDTNIPEAWTIKEMVNMKQNRANIIPSHLMHRAEPVGGFGSGPEDGRIALIAFFA